MVIAIIHQHFFRDNTPHQQMTSHIEGLTDMYFFISMYKGRIIEAEISRAFYFKGQLRWCRRAAAMMLPQFINHVLIRRWHFGYDDLTAAYNAFQRLVSMPEPENILPARNLTQQIHRKY